MFQIACLNHITEPFNGLGKLLGALSSETTSSHHPLDQIIRFHVAWHCVSMDLEEHKQSSHQIQPKEPQLRRIIDV